MEVKIFSALEKCFLDEDFSAKTEYTRGTCFMNEKFGFTVGYGEGRECGWSHYLTLEVVSPIKDFITVRRIEHVPVHNPCCFGAKDDNYLRTTAGLYPDLLLPVRPYDRIVIGANYESLYVEVEPDGKIPAGEYPIEIKFNELDGAASYSATFTLEIIGAELPKQELMHTEWFYCDCLQDYYHTESFDERHWEIIENFMKTAVKRGINMILTPLFTPALDTFIGGERTTTQLVGVTVQNGKYSFDFSFLDRWVDMCDRIGVKYFEISHFFTQWGAAHSPKVMATVDGEYKKIFGWETDACGEEYKAFLNALIPEFLAFMKSKNGADKRCWFHISDEPIMKDLEQYTASRMVVKDLLSGYPIIDALSDYEFYKTGAVTKPVPSTDHIEPFLENNVPDLWTYYCCGQAVDVSNRFISMPSARTRVIGTQLYKYNIVGFLHWGYNFYSTQYSYDKLNPFVRTDGEYFVQSGDTFMVYPAPDGTAYESLRLVVFEQALQDLRALKLCESLCGREETMKILEDGIDPITFKNYPHSDKWLLDLRQRVNAAIKAKI